jgi:hypothetical protein
MRWARLIAVLVIFAAFPPGNARAQAQQSEVDRLRDALRGLTVQLRTLEDQRVALQARLAESDRERQRLNQLAESLRQQLTNSQDALQMAIQEFNQRLTERDENLEKWKAAYNEAADVAREKDAQRAKFETESTTYKARTKSCEAKNAKLIDISNDMLENYRNLNLHLFVNVNAPTPLVGPLLIEHQNRTQDFRDRILDQDVKVPTPSPEQQKAQQQKGQEQKPQDQKARDQKSTEQKPQEQKGQDKTVKSQQAVDPKARKQAGSERAKP